MFLQILCGPTSFLLQPCLIWVYPRLFPSLCFSQECLPSFLLFTLFTEQAILPQPYKSTAYTFQFLWNSSNSFPWLFERMLSRAILLVCSLYWDTQVSVLWTREGHKQSWNTDIVPAQALSSYATHAIYQSEPWVHCNSDFPQRYSCSLVWLGR